MTFLYPQLPPQGEAAPKVLASEAAPTVLTTPQPSHSDEYIRHLLIGSPQAIRETIYLLQARRYVDHAQWSGPLPVGEGGIRITHNEGEAFVPTRAKPSSPT